MRVSRIAATEVEFIGDANAPAVVDDPCSAGRQCIPPGLVHRTVIAANNAVFGAGVAVVRHDDLRAIRHTMHGATVSVTGGNAADVGAVRAQFAIGAGGRAAIVNKRVTGFDPNVGVGVFANPCSHHGDHFVRATEFGVLGVHRLVEDPEFDAFTAVTCRVSVLRVDGAQPPVGLEFRAAPAVRLPAPPCFYIRCGLRLA